MSSSGRQLSHIFWRRTHWNIQLVGRNILQSLLVEWETERYNESVFGSGARFKVNKIWRRMGYEGMKARAVATG